MRGHVVLAVVATVLASCDWTHEAAPGFCGMLLGVPLQISCRREGGRAFGISRSSCKSSGTSEALGAGGDNCVPFYVDVRIIGIGTGKWWSVQPDVAESA